MAALFAVFRPRQLEQVVPGRPTRDGAGVRLVRLLEGELQQRLDPFLMLDAFGSDDPQDYLPGFPPHPHRGFETVTCMLAGRMRHRDSTGAEGVLEPGDVQWMTAAAGIVHSEMPEQVDGRLAGFQLWLNLPAADKLRPAAYRDIPAASIPQLAIEGGQVRVIAGAFRDVVGAVQRPVTCPLLLEIDLAAGHSLPVPLDAALNAFVVLASGRAAIGQTPLAPDQLGILEAAPETDGVVIRALEDCRLLLAAGYPLQEPICQQGPFVMNTQEEIRQTLRDWQQGRFPGSEQ